MARSRATNTTPSPRRPSPDTHSPITAPDLKAILRAFVIPDSFAAHAVLTLPSVATFIPKNPASTDRSAPRTYKHAVIQLFRPIPMRRNKATITIIIVLYSLLRNAMAPSLMYPEISFIRSVPSSSLPIHVDKENATNRPMMADTGAAQLKTVRSIFLSSF